MLRSAALPISWLMGMLRRGDPGETSRSEGLVLSVRGREDVGGLARTMFFTNTAAIED